MSTRNYQSAVRARHAEDTRHGIIEAARTLFVESGYTKTSVADIAAAAGVAQNTVYARVGGKPALILALLEDDAGDDDTDAAVARIEREREPGEIVRLTAMCTGQISRRELTTMTVLAANRGADPAVDAVADRAAARYRSRVSRIAAHLTQVEGLRPEVTASRAEDILWFHFGPEAWRTVRALGWGWGSAGGWLTEQASHALLATTPDDA
jgi:AcrR family transcriptional regulator